MLIGGMTISQPIPNHLRRIRREAGLTQAQVAWMLRLSGRGQLWLWERGLACPTLSHLLMLSILYQRLPAELYMELYSLLKGDILPRLRHVRRRSSEAGLPSNTLAADAVVNHEVIHP